jgi:hypothetical protein
MYIHIYQKETLCVATFISNKNVIFFFFILQNWRIGRWNRSCVGARGLVLVGRGWESE